MTRVWRYVKSAPLTYSWLVVLLITTIVQRSIPARLHELLQKESTNLHHLGSDPIRVLIQSLLWIDGKYWWPYFVVGTIGVLTYQIPPRWRWLYLVAALVVFGISLAVKHDYTQLGHFSALLIGLACYPLTRSRRREPAAA